MLSALPSSTIFPPYITITLSHIWDTTPKSCEINKIDNPFFFLSSSKSDKICACTVTSNAVVGSSAIISSGSFVNAIAIETLCLIPPESSCG